MKNEDETMVWCKQVITVEKPFLTISRPFTSREETDVNTACSKSMAGDEVHVSFAASSQIHSGQPIMPNCQLSHTNKFRGAFISLSLFYTFWKLKWQDFVSCSQLLCIFIEVKK